MTSPANTKARLWARIARIQLALWAMRGAQALDALADRLLPEDFRRGRDDHGSRESKN
ncbi:MAG: hypothetical protein WC689_00595 [Methylocystis sp.]|jgi:hypothetical protein